MGKQILVVDDDPFSRELLWGYLAGEGYIVVEAANTNQARIIIDRETPDLILLDVMMPEEDGFTFCQVIKKRWQEPFLPVIFITALHDQQSRLRGLACGADDFLSKPIDRLELLIKVRNMLKIRELHANLYNELVFARRVQENLFFSNDALNQKDKLFYQPCRQVGGDLIEVWEQDGSRWAFLADATGHGPSAALIATAVKALIDKSCTNPSALLTQLNTKLHTLLANEHATYYVTGICVKLAGQILSFAGAGHPPGFLMGKSSLVQLESRFMPLGISPTQYFEEQSFPYQAGDLLFLYSDGLFDILGENELIAILSEDIARQDIYKKLAEQIEKGEPTDDISFALLTLP